MSRELFLCKITLSGGSPKYISTTDYPGSVQYSRQVIAPPSLSLTGKSYVKQQFGSMEIRHDPEDPSAVFNYFDGTWPPPSGEFDVEIQFGEQEEPLFSGKGSIREIRSTSVMFDLLDADVEQDLLELSLDERRILVEQLVDASGVIRVTANAHELIDGSEAIFEGLNATTLNYDGTSDRVFEVVLVDENTFDLKDTDATQHLMGIEGAGHVSVPVVRPMAFGVVTHQSTVKKKEDLLVNPHFDPTQTIHVFEDGVLVGTTWSTPDQFSVPPTAQEIQLNGVIQGEVSVTGLGINAAYLLELFQYACTRLGLTLDATKAPQSNEISISFIISTQMKIKEMLERVAINFNHLFYIRGSTLHLVDRAYTETPKTVETFLSNAVSEPAPIARAESRWQLRSPFSGTAKRLGTLEKYAFVNSQRFTTGNPISVDAYVESDAQMQKILRAYMATEEQTEFSITVPEIDFETRPGDLLTWTDPNTALSCTMIVTGVRGWDFLKEQTTFSGKGTKSILVRS